MDVPKGIVVVSSTEPTEFFTGDVELRKLRPEFYVWVNINTGEYRWWNPKTTSWEILPIQSHDHSEFKEITVEGDAQFNRLIKVGDMEGQTTEIKTEGGTMVFKNGILVKYG